MTIGRRVAVTTRKTIVRPAIRMLSAISLGVLRREVPSTRAIMRSRKLAPGSWVMRTTIRSESTRVPPVTALRSPPDSRMTGADSPVMADSSTEATPSTTSPSPGIRSPASQTTRSPGRSWEAGTLSSCPPSSRRRAIISLRVARRAFAWALPRPSATASARFAKTTVNHSQRATTPVNHRPSVRPRKRSARKIPVVIALPTSTTNITGLRIWTRGSSLRKDAQSAGTMMSLVKSLRRGREAMVMGVGADRRAGPGRG